MSSRDFEERHLGRFRHGTDRRVELTLQEELDNVAKASIMELAAKKEAKHQQPLPESQRHARKLAPEFVPKRVREKRKTHPIFHDDLQSKSARDKSPKPGMVRPADIPPYNPLDKEGTGMKLAIQPSSKLNKFPYSKPETITTREMKTPHISSVGVIPVRASEKIDGLNVVMEGGKALQSDQDPVFGPMERANTAQMDLEARTDTEDLISVSRQGTPRLDPLAPRPAIVSQTGAIQPITFTNRPQPPLKNRSKLKAPPRTARVKSAESIASSMASVEIPLPPGGEAQEDQRSTSSQQSVKSVKELLEEAKQINSPEERKAYQRKRASRERANLEKETPSKSRLRESGTKKKSAASSKSSKSGRSNPKSAGSKTEESKERTVDEIISSLKTQSKGVKTSEADRKIQEIMKRVLSRTAAVLGDLDDEDGTESSDSAEDAPGEPIQETQEMSPEEDDQSNSFKPPIFVVKEETATDLDENTTLAPTERGESEMLVSSALDAELTDTPGLPDTPAVIKEALEKLEEQAKKKGSPEEDLATSTDGELIMEVPPTEPSKAPTPDLRQFYEDLVAPAEVTYEDIISVNAQNSILHPREKEQHASPAPSSARESMSFLSSWIPLEGAEKPAAVQRGPERSVHHFCTVTGEFQLPDHLRGTWRRYHMPNKYNFTQKEGRKIPVVQTSPLLTAHKSQVLTSQSMLEITPEEKEALEREQSAAAQRIMVEAQQAEQQQQQQQQQEGSLEDWQTKAEQMFDTSDLVIDGKKMETRTDESFLYWTPAPPKWDITPAKVKETLFPSYHGAALATESEAAALVVEEDSESEEEEEETVEEMDPEDRMARDRVLNRTYKSSEDLTLMVKIKKQREDDMKAGRIPRDKPSTASRTESMWTLTSEGSTMQSAAQSNRTMSGRQQGARQSDLDSISEAGYSHMSDISSIPPPPVQHMISFADLRAKFSQQATVQVSEDGDEHHEEESVMPDDEVFPIFLPSRRRHSAPGWLLHDGVEDDFILVYEDFNAAMDEITKQKQILKDIRSGKRPPPGAEKDMEEEPEPEEENAHIVEKDRPKGRERVTIFDMMKKEDEPTPAELALQAGRAYVLLPKKKKKKKTIDVDIARIEAIQNFLAQKPSAGSLQRVESLPDLRAPPKREFRVPHKLRKKRGSIPDMNEFEEYISKRGYKEEENPREFVRDIWNKWFDQVYPSTPNESDWEDDEDEDDEEEIEEEQQAQEAGKRKGSSVSSVISQSLDMDPLIEDDEDMENVELIQAEVNKLSHKMSKSSEPNTFHLARRGALYRKLGKIKSAEEDLNKAIEMEPLLIDAYWHRHLLYLLQNKRQAALDDLNFILKYNRHHAGAYKSRAMVCKDTGDITMAVVNFTQAIKLNPDDYEAYYQRAEMYESRGEMLLAMEDYAMATKLMPSKTEALFKHGMHYFNNGNWQSAINDFTELLKTDPHDAKARTYRGQAYSKMKAWTSAVEDLSAAVHLDPNNKVALYYRGCILRKLHPKRALQDFSVSLMIDDSEDNILAYLHRGILYNEIGRHEDAIPDFEAVLKLDKDKAVAHVNLGLIYMLKMENHHRAIKKFTQAIKADPTYAKAYVCRAEAYTKLHDIKNALTDFTRAIHLQPDVHHYYMYRGQLVLKMGNLELAAFCVKHAAELNAGLGQSATQQAIVQSFLKNYDKAIEALESATRVKPVAPLFMLLGKTQMKAKLWNNSVASFERALDIVKPWGGTSTPWPSEAAELYYLIGMCHVEKRNFLDAHDAFNDAIKVDNKYAEAFYQRGLTRMRLKQSKGIQDFNRALALNPKLFQAYLSRAGYYGIRGQYTKGILNCNEAIKLQPNSVRSYLYRGALKYYIKAYKLAIHDLTQATLIDNQCALAYFNRAICYQDSANYQKALQDYGIVLLLGDDLRLKVLLNRGLLYFDRKDYKNALHDFQLAAEIDPRNKKIHHTLGLCLHKLQRLKESVESFSRSTKLDVFFLDGYIGRGNVFMDYGNEMGQLMARRDYQRALHIDPYCLSARVNLAFNLQVAGRYQLAWHQFTTAINTDPNFKPALEGRAIINLQMSDTYAAYQDISASINVAPSAELLTNRGVIYQFMGERANAMRDYQQALKMDPTYALAYFNAANIYFHMRQFKQALAYYHQALQYNPKDESAFLNSAICKVMLRDSAGALKDFGNALRLSPYSAHIYFNRANLYVSMKEYHLAESDFSKSLELQPDDALVLKRRADVRGKIGRRKEAISDYQLAIEIQTMRKKYQSMGAAI